MGYVDRSELYELARQAAPEGDRLHPVSLSELLERQFPPRENVIAPWLPEKGLAMLYAPRGVGKTYVALGVGYAVAIGGRFLKWEAPKPRKVLLVDGEMPAVELQSRLAALVEEAGSVPRPGHFSIIANDFEEDGIPDLATQDGQAALEAQIGDADFIILDNISTLCRSGRENEQESWTSVQEFALRLRRRGKSVLFVHHAGKGGAQRGTSKREDVLDTVITLKRPAGYRADEGARFEVHFEKNRRFFGPDAEPFEAALDPVTGTWSWRQIQHGDGDLTARIQQKVANGMSQNQAAKECGVSKSTASRAMRGALLDGDEGDLPF